MSSASPRRICPLSHGLCTYACESLIAIVRIRPLSHASQVCIDTYGCNRSEWKMMGQKPITALRSCTRSCALTLPWACFTSSPLSGTHVAIVYSIVRIFYSIVVYLPHNVQKIVNDSPLRFYFVPEVWMPSPTCSLEVPGFSRNLVQYRTVRVSAVKLRHDYEWSHDQLHIVFLSPCSLLEGCDRCMS